MVLSARDLQPSCRLIARASSDEAAAKLRLAGATVVVSPYIAGGRVMAASALRPLAINFMELLVGSNYEIEEIQLRSDPLHLLNVQGRSLQELELGRRSGALVLAIREGSDLIANPGGETKLAPGQLLIVLGSRPQLKRFQDSWERRSTALKPWPAELAIRPIPTILRAQTLHDHLLASPARPPW